MKQFRPVFYVSDGTGITAETIGHSLLTQFAGSEFHTRRIAFVDNEEKALDVASQARQAGERAGVRSIIISTVIDGRLNAILGESGALLIDAFTPFIAILEREFGVARQPHLGPGHGMVNQPA